VFLKSPGLPRVQRLTNLAVVRRRGRGGRAAAGGLRDDADRAEAAARAARRSRPRPRAADEGRDAEDDEDRGRRARARRGCPVP